MGTKKQIAFDLDTKELEKRYVESDWHNAYYDIKKSMKENGFKHQQGSIDGSI